MRWRQASYFQQQHQQQTPLPLTLPPSSPSKSAARGSRRISSRAWSLFSLDSQSSFASISKILAVLLFLYMVLFSIYIDHMNPLLKWNTLPGMLKIYFGIVWIGSVLVMMAVVYKETDWELLNAVLLAIELTLALSLPVVFRIYQSRINASNYRGTYSGGDQEFLHLSWKQKLDLQKRSGLLNTNDAQQISPYLEMTSRCCDDRVRDALGYLLFDRYSPESSLLFNELNSEEVDIKLVRNTLNVGSGLSKIALGARSGNRLGLGLNLGLGGSSKRNPRAKKAGPEHFASDVDSATEAEVEVEADGIRNAGHSVPLSPGMKSDIRILASVRGGMSCDTVCKTGGLICNGESFSYINSCEILERVFPCRDCGIMKDIYHVGYPGMLFINMIPKNTSNPSDTGIYPADEMILALEREETDDWSGDTFASGLPVETNVAHPDAFLIAPHMHRLCFQAKTLPLDSSGAKSYIKALGDLEQSIDLDTSTQNSICAYSNRNVYRMCPCISA